MLIQCSSISEVHGNIDTSPCRSNIESRPKGVGGYPTCHHDHDDDDDHDHDHDEDDDPSRFGQPMAFDRNHI